MIRCLAGALAVVLSATGLPALGLEPAEAPVTEEPAVPETADEAVPETGDEAVPETGDEPAPEGCLIVVNTPGEARVEIDGMPLDAVDRARAADCLPIAAGTYLVTVFPEAAPPFEAFVDVVAGERAVVALEEPVPPPRRLPPAPPPPEPRLGPTLVAGALLSGGTAAVWWQLSDRSRRSADVIRARDDLDPHTKAHILADLEQRRRLRRDFATVSAATGAALLVAGAITWRLAGGEGDVALQARPGYGGILAEVRFP